MTTPTRVPFLVRACMYVVVAMIFFFSFFFKGFILKNNHRHAFFSRPKKFEICLNLKCFYLPLNDVIRIGPDGGFGELFENAGQFGSEVGPITDLIRHAVQSGHDGVLSLFFLYYFSYSRRERGFFQLFEELDGMLLLAE
jgi:hypothetical protein